MFERIRRIFYILSVSFGIKFKKCRSDKYIVYMFRRLHP